MLGATRSGATTTKLSNTTKHRGKSWTHYVRKIQPDIVVLSAGPHLKHEAELTSIIDTVVREHDAHFPSMQLVWRSQVGAGCGPKPLDRPPTQKFWDSYTGRLYNYRRLLSFDGIAKERFPGRNRYSMDLRPLAQRIDFRLGSEPGTLYPKDCLHFCPGGPLEDLVPRAFAQLLRNLPPPAAQARASPASDAKPGGAPSHSDRPQPARPPPRAHPSSSIQARRPRERDRVRRVRRGRAANKDQLHRSRAPAKPRGNGPPG